MMDVISHDAIFAANRTEAPKSSSIVFTLWCRGSRIYISRINSVQFFVLHSCKIAGHFYDLARHQIREGWHTWLIIYRKNAFINHLGRRLGKTPNNMKLYNNNNNNNGRHDKTNKVVIGKPPP